MSSTLSSTLRNFRQPVATICIAALLMSGTALADPVETAATDEKRVTVSTFKSSGGRDGAGNVTTSTDEHEALKKDGSRDKTGTRGSSAKPGGNEQASMSTNYDFWFYDADVILFNDDDNDGYYHGIDLLFDVDTNFISADIYAVMYLSYEGGPWNEYAATDDFTVFGTSSDDEYVVISELDSGYPTGSYDLLIEIFDAYDGTFLTSFGPSDTSELAFLALEDFNRDAPVIVEPRVVVTRSGGGGAMDGWLIGGFIVLLLGGAIRKIWRRRNDTLVRIDSPAPYWQDGASNNNGSFS